MFDALPRSRRQLEWLRNAILAGLPLAPNSDSLTVHSVRRLICPFFPPAYRVKLRLTNGQLPLH
jgi:hypothetical protein